MKKYLRVFLILGVLLFNACSLYAQGKEPSAPDFSLKDKNSQVFSLSAFRDKQPVLLFFWTTWCPFCNRELPVLNKKMPELTAAGFQVLAVNVGESSNAAERAVRPLKLNLIILFDRDGKVSDNFGVLGVPTYILINKKGKIVYNGNAFPANYKSLIE